MNVRRTSLAFIALLATLQIANNLLPYLGLRDDSCQTMFSGLRWWPGGNNHYVAPQRMSADLWAYYDDVHAELTPPPEPGRARELADFLNQDDRRLNTEAVRVVVRQLCDRGHAVRLDYTVRGDVRHAEDACAVPVLSDPHAAIPIRLYDSHVPGRAE